MFQWLRKKKYPDFWEEYTNHFKTKLPNKMEDIRFVVFDTETTGVDINHDRILSIGAVGITKNVIDVSDTFEVYLEQDRFDASTVEIHGILKEGKFTKISEEEAVIQFLKYIKNSVLVAHHAAFDVTVINAALKRLELPKLKNIAIDTGTMYKKTSFHNGNKSHYSLDYILNKFNIKGHDRHTSSGDAYITALVFFKILSEMSRSRKVTLNYLVSSPERRGLL